MPLRPAGAGGRESKIALFTNVEQRAVISVPDVDTIFKVPQLLHDQMLDEIVCHTLDLLAKPANLAPWTHIVDARCARNTRLISLCRQSTSN